MKNKKVIDAFGVTFVTLLGKLMCFAFDALLSAKYGVGAVTDAFIMAHALPTIMFDGISTAIITCYIPVFSKIDYEEPDKGKYYNGSVLLFVLLMSFTLSTIIYVFNGPFLRIYAHGFGFESRQLLTVYTKIMIWSIPFIGVFGVLRAYIQVKGSKALSNFQQVLTYAVLFIALIAFFPNDVALSWATLAGNVIAFVFFLIIAVKYGFRVNFKEGLRNKYIGSVVKLMLPIFVSTLVADINSFADKYFSSFYETGIVTSMNYGYKLSFAIQGIIATSIVVVLYPEYSKSVAKGKYDRLVVQVKKTIDIIAWIIMPIVVGGIILAKPIIKLVYGHGNFMDENVRITTEIFSVYMLGVFPMSLKLVGDRTEYALKKTNYAFYTSCVTVGLNILLNIVFSRMWGYIGLAYATVISISIGACVNFVLLNKVYSEFKLIDVLKQLFMPFFSAVFMGLVVETVLKNMLVTNDILVILIGILVGVISYALIIFVFFRKQVQPIVDIFKRNKRNE